MQNLEPQQLIGASKLFRNLQTQEAEAIIARLQSASYERGARIMERGVWHGRLHIVAWGQVSILLQEGDVAANFVSTSRPLNHVNHDLVVARLGPGECFGEMSLITGEAPTATVRAEQDTMLWSLTQTDFLTLIGACPTLLKNINIILSQRLAQTNRQILANQSGERIWLCIMHDPSAELERTLAYHIADALATRSQKRVLVLEVCEQDRAMGLQFALHEQQSRPTLLECQQDHNLLQIHRTPTVTPDGQYYAAYSSLAATSGKASSLDASILADVTDLAALYDYVLLVTTERTPPHFIEALRDYSQRTIVLVSASQHYTFSGPIHQSSAVFVAHVPERPTIGVQDQYAARLEHEITRLLPAGTQLLETCWQRGETLRQVAPDSDLSTAVDFVARHIAHQTVGIAFGGGGARGFAHLGVLERLVQHNIPLDYIAACSSGIIAPGMYLMGKSFAESEAILLDIQHHIVQWRLPRTSIFSNRGLKRALRDLCGDLRFEDLTTPFAMVAVDLTTRAGVVLDRGPLWQAGLASVALPGIFPPVLVGEHILMDAGMHDPVPTRLVRQMGADILLASELGGQEPPSLVSATPWLEADGTITSGTPSPASQPASRIGPLPRHTARSPHIIDLLLRTYDLAMATIGMHSIREADIVIRPKLHRVSLRQFSEGRKFIAAGRDAVEQSLPALRERLPWL